MIPYYTIVHYAILYSTHYGVYSTVVWGVITDMFGPSTVQHWAFVKSIHLGFLIILYVLFYESLKDEM